MNGNDYIDRILAYDDRAPTGSSYLDAIKRLPLDKHDVQGMLFLADEALSNIEEDDPFHETFSQVLVTFTRKDKRYSQHDGRGILAMCRDALDKAPVSSLSI